MGWKLIEIAVLSVMCAGVCAQMASAEVTRICDGMKFPEGPAYDGKQHVYFSQASAAAIARVSLDGKVEPEWMKGSSGQTPLRFTNTNGLTFFKDGSLFACDNKRNAIVRIWPDQRCEIYASHWNSEPFRGPNDLAFDDKGNLFFTDPTGSRLDNPVGPVYRVEAETRKVTRVAGGMAFPNGLAFSKDGRWLYVAESNKNRIVRFSVRGDGMLGPLEAFADLAEAGKGEPDGIAVDTEGNVWVAHYGTHQVLVVSPDGGIAARYPMPEGKGDGPTNVEFAGKDMRTLYITDPTTGALLRMRAPVAGLKLFCAP